MSKTSSSGSGQRSRSSQAGAAAPATPAAPAAAPPQETAHARFQSASDQYFGDVNAVWSDTQRRVQELQLDFMRAQVQLGHRQPPLDSQSLQAEFQSLQVDFQKQFEVLANDPDPAKRLVGAYATYRDAVRKGLADVDGDALDPVTLGLIAQQVLGVSQIAEQIRQSVTRPDAAPSA